MPTTPITPSKPTQVAGPTTHTVQSIADHVGGDLAGPGDVTITGINDLGHARCGELTFVGEQRYADRWPTSQASAALANRELSLSCDNGKVLIQVDDADLALARALELFETKPVETTLGVDPSAKVHTQATVGENVSIGPGCYIGPGASIGCDSVLHANVVVLDEAQIGQQVHLWPGVVIGARCLVGDQTMIHPNAVIGADGFGYRPDKDDQGRPLIRKLNHIGTVRIGSRVEIGAGTCIDRAKFAQTTVGDQTKIDNLVQIGHNCRIGDCVLIAGSCAIAGTVNIGDRAILGGGAHIADHLEIGPGARIAGSAGVIGDVPAGASWAGAPAKPIKTAAREELAIRRLPDLMKRFKSQ